MTRLADSYSEHSGPSIHLEIVVACIAVSRADLEAKQRDTGNYSTSYQVAATVIKLGGASIEAHDDYCVMQTSGYLFC